MKKDEAYLLEIIASISSGDLDAAEKKLRHWGKVRKANIEERLSCDDYDIQQNRQFEENCYYAIIDLNYYQNEHYIDYTISHTIANLKTIKAYQNETMEKIA
jgi:hypothetical protein